MPNFIKFGEAVLELYKWTGIQAGREANRRKDVAELTDIFL
jgi:hypothetical protein